MIATMDGLESLNDNAYDISNMVCDLDILLNTILEKADGIRCNGNPELIAAVNAINCFTTCAQRSTAVLQRLNTASQEVIKQMTGGECQLS